VNPEMEKLYERLLTLYGLRGTGPRKRWAEREDQILNLQTEILKKERDEKIA